MYKRVLLISFFVLLNTVLGRFFQNTVNSLCFTELIIFGISNFLFWNFTAASIQSWNLKWNIFKDFKLIFIHAGLGLSTSIINILIGQGLIAFYGYFMYEGYVSFNYNFINASHTNHIAVNLLCYFALVIYFLYSQQKETYKNNEAVAEKLATEISVSRGGMKFNLLTEKIIYVESANNCVVLHTSSGKFVKYQSLKSIQSILPTDDFIRTHRSFLVNISTINYISKNKNGDGVLFLNTGDKLKFSRTYQHLIPQ